MIFKTKKDRFKRILGIVLTPFIIGGKEMKEGIGSTFGVKELARYLGVAEITVYRLTEKRKIPAKKVGAQWRYLKDEIDRWMRERE